MATQTYLISVETLKNFYPIDQNAEQVNIISNIHKAESFQLLPLIGRDKYNELITYVNSIKTGATRDDDNDMLLAMIEPVIGWYVTGEILYNQTFKTKNIGVTQDQTMFYSVSKAAQKYRDDSNSYLQLLREYLTVNEIKEEDNFTTNHSLFLGDTSSSDKPIVGAISITEYKTGLYF